MRVRVWNEEEWLSSKAVYDDLLSRSCADPLFLSWDWQTLWWQHLSQRSADERLTVHAAYDGATLIGTLVVVSGEVLRRSKLRYRSAQVLGNRMLESRGAIGEYLDVVAVAGREAEVRIACIQSVLQNEQCSEVVVGWCAAGLAWVEAIDALPRRTWGHLRVINPMVGYQADLSGGFERYLASLSGNARRSLFNLRHKLSDRGAATVCTVPASEQDAALQEMNRLHALRWGAPALTGDTLLVSQSLIARWTARGRIHISVIKIDNRCVSVLYDVRVGGTQYNIQMGFDSNFDSAISLGLLHLGYAMEQAALDGVQTYDFLAGTGRSADYKKRIASHSYNVVSIQYLHNPFVASVFRAYDAIKGWRERTARATAATTDEKAD